MKFLAKEKKKLIKKINPLRKGPCCYLLFAREKKAELLQESPKLPQSELLKAVGRAWSALGDSEKQKYRDMYSAEKEQLLDAKVEKDKLLEKLGLNAKRPYRKQKPSRPSSHLDAFRVFK